MEMSKRFKRLREAAGLSQAKLAKAAGVPLRTYQSWEYGLRTPLLDTAVRLAAALRVTVDELAGVVPIGVGDQSPLPSDERLERARANLQGGRRKGGAR
jgi:transcriptional regulator with XRE-family HTH domain